VVDLCAGPLAQWMPRVAASMDLCLQVVLDLLPNLMVPASTCTQLVNQSMSPSMFTKHVHSMFAQCSLNVHSM
jgi:hypothetical protein